MHQGQSDQLKEEEIQIKQQINEPPLHNDTVTNEPMVEEPQETRFHIRKRIFALSLTLSQHYSEI